MKKIDPIHYLNLFLKGQENNKRLLSPMMSEILNGGNLNILIRGPSGYGKTLLGEAIFSYIGYVSGEYYKYYLCYKEGVNIVEDKRLHLLDEVHLIISPEYLYPYMDKGNKSFILCSNEYSDLKEALERRCLIINLERYSEEDLIEIAKDFFTRRGISIPDNYYIPIVNASRLNPLELHNNCIKLNLIFKQRGVPESVEELDENISNYLGIRFGYNEIDRRYLNLLGRLGTASLDTLSYTLNVPKQTIRSEIEPYLIERNKIKIGSRGRSLCQN